MCKKGPCKSAESAAKLQNWSIVSPLVHKHLWQTFSLWFVCCFPMQNTSLANQKQQTLSSPQGKKTTTPTLPPLSLWNEAIN